MNLSSQSREALARALDDFDPDREHYLRLDDGSVLTFDVSDASDETRELLQVVQGEGAALWRRVPSRSSRDAFEEMEDFVELLGAGETRNLLFVTLEGRGAFRAFREFMLDHPNERARWEEFREGRSRRRLDTFLSTVEREPNEMTRAESQTS